MVVRSDARAYRREWRGREEGAGASTRSALDEPLLLRPRFVRWCPRVGDIAAILLCTVPALAGLPVAAPAHAWIGYLCVAGVGLALVFRRARPFPVLVVAVALGTLNPVSWAGAGAAFFESFITVFTLAVRARPLIAVIGYLVCEAIILNVTGGLVLLGAREGPPAVPWQPGALIALCLGIAVRANRLRREAIAEAIAVREEQAAAAERARITAEMHDVVAHSLTVMIALAGGARAGWEKHPERSRAALEQLGGVGAQALADMQRILRVMRGDADGAPALENSGADLEPLDSVVEVFRAAGLPVTLTGGEDEIPDDPILRTTVHRIVQEALTDTLRHAARPTRVEVVIARVGEELTVTVTDDGRGRPEPVRVGAGVGLRAMRERAEAFGGRFEAGPVPGEASIPRGWRTHVVLPVDGGGRRG